MNQVTQDLEFRCQRRSCGPIFISNWSKFLENRVTIFIILFMKTNHVQSATGLPPVSTLSAPMHARLISKTENEFRTRDNTKDNATAKVTTRNKWPRIIVTKHGKRLFLLK